MCGQKIDYYKDSFKLKFHESSPTNNRRKYSSFYFCSLECLSIYVLRHFGKNDLGHIEFKK